MAKDDKRNALLAAGLAAAKNSTPTKVTVSPSPTKMVTVRLKSGFDYAVGRMVYSANSTLGTPRNYEVDAATAKTLLDCRDYSGQAVFEVVE